MHIRDTSNRGLSQIKLCQKSKRKHIISAEPTPGQLGFSPQRHPEVESKQMLSLYVKLEGFVKI